jgi:hypothetical protein
MNAKNIVPHKLDEPLEASLQGYRTVRRHAPELSEKWRTTIFTGYEKAGQPAIEAAHR